MRPHKYLTPNEMTNSSLKRLFNKHNKSSQLTLTLASLGLLLLLIGTFTLPFNQGLFSHLFTKPASHADTMSTMGPQHIGCEFLSDPNATPAFCDTFQNISQGDGRTGDLDPRLWSFDRFVQQGWNPTQGQNGGALFTDAFFCQTPIGGVRIDHDSYFCDANGTEPRHWMEAFDDGGTKVGNDARILQPFDFTNRTGTITFDVDLKSVSHGWWPEIWITDEPVPQPNVDLNSPPRNAILISFEGDCYHATGPGGDYGLGNVGPIRVVNNYVATYVNYSLVDTNGSGCYSWKPDHANHVEIRLSQQNLEVWVSEPDGANFRKTITASNLNLPFSKGYINFEHWQYNGLKVDVTDAQTYHWHNLGFDGPILPTPRSYEIPDNTELSSVGQATGYYITTSGTMQKNQYPTYTSQPPFMINNVDLTNVIEARINLDGYNFTDTNPLYYRFNSGTWRPLQQPPSTLNLSYGSPFEDSTIVPLTDLVQGSNTLEFKSSTDLAGVFNIGLELELDPSVTYPVISPQPITQNPAAHITVVPSDFPSGEHQSIGLPFNALVSMYVEKEQVPITQASANVAISPNLRVEGITPGTCNMNFTKAPTASDLSFAGSLPNTTTTACVVYYLRLIPTATGSGGLTLSNGLIKDIQNNEILSKTAGLVNGNWTPSLVKPGDEYHGEYPTDALAPFATIMSMSPMPSSSMSPAPSLPPMGNILTVITSASPSTVAPNQTISIDTSLTNNYQAMLNGGITLSIVDPAGNLVQTQLVDNTSSMSFMPNVPMSHSLSYTLPANSPTGAYTVAENVTSSDGLTTYYDNPTVTSFLVTALASSPTPQPSMNMTPSPTSNPSGTAILGDFNGDSHVNLVDLSIFAGSYGTSSPNIPNPECDLNSDGMVNLTDLSLLATNYGK